MRIRSPTNATSPAASKLTARQQRFVDAYTGPARGNATEGARLAGYAGNDVTLASVGAENLRKPQVAAAIEQATADTRARAIAERFEIQALLTSIARGKGKEPHVLQNGRIVKAGPTFAARTSAAMSLAKMRGYLIDKIEVKAADQMKAQLEQLRKRMTPEAFEQLLEALVGEE